MSSASSRLWDVAIVGGGIVGAATGMALARRGVVRVVILEAEATLAAHQTGHNSGVIHSGLYYKPGSLKARNSRRRPRRPLPILRGARRSRTSAAARSSWPSIPRSFRRSRSSNVAAAPTASQGLRRLRGEQLKDHEPAVAGIAGLFVPGHRHRRLQRRDEGLRRHRDGAPAAKGGRARGCSRVLRRPERSSWRPPAARSRRATLINCAGLQSDRVARLCGVDPGVTIVPFRGEYYEVVPERHALVRNLIYPVPDPRFPFLGVHFTRMIDGGVEAGPNAVLAFRREGYTRTSFSARDTAEMVAWPGFWRMAAKYWPMALGEMAPVVQHARIREGPSQAGPGPACRRRATAPVPASARRRSTARAGSSTTSALSRPSGWCTC